mgnify:CR=1 FL=1
MQELKARKAAAAAQAAAAKKQEREESMREYMRLQACPLCYRAQVMRCLGVAWQEEAKREAAQRKRQQEEAARRVGELVSVHVIPRPSTDLEGYLPEGDA